MLEENLMLTSGGKSSGNQEARADLKSDQCSAVDLCEKISHDPGDHWIMGHRQIEMRHEKRSGKRERK